MDLLKITKIYPVSNTLVTRFDFLYLNTQVLNEPVTIDFIVYIFKCMAHHSLPVVLLNLVLFAEHGKGVTAVVRGMLLNSQLFQFGIHVKPEIIWLAL